MRPHPLPLTALSAWSKLNDVSFLDVKISPLPGSRGNGIVTERKLSSKGVFDRPRLLGVPLDLILGREGVEERGKEDGRVVELVQVAGGKSTRGDVMLFLLMQITIASAEDGHKIGLCNPWTEYVKMLPESVPVPSLWTEVERIALLATSLEPAVNAKLAALQREFDELREKTETIPWCHKYWWDNETLLIQDWALLDAWYRSRCLELPNLGECMIPCVDMVNHSAEPNAYYEKVTNDGVALLLRPDIELEEGTEITISYGTNKSQAEMLFSYGFIDEKSTTQSLVLTLEPFPDDPLGKAKATAFTKTLSVKISYEEESIKWESPFLYFMCLNEEDGLSFGVLQETDGSTSKLKTFWQEKDVSDITDTFEALINDHPLKDVFKLRVVALLHDRIRQQLENLYESDEEAHAPVLQEMADLDRLKSAWQLRKSETAILEKAFEAVDSQKTKLLESEVVLQYLGSVAEANSEERTMDVEETNDVEEEEDFS